MKETVLITGASSGMGLETALIFAQNGYDVMAGVRTSEGAEAVLKAAADTNVKVDIVKLDVQDKSVIESAIESTITRFGKIDILVNNAGYGLVASVEDGTDEEFLRQFDVNVFGVLRTSRAVIPHMRKRESGTIINISSFLGQVGLPLLAHYNASKYAVEGLTDSLRPELRPFGIRVHTVAPGLFRTNFASKGLAANSKTFDRESPYSCFTSGFVGEVSRRITEGPSPVAVAEAVYMVASDPSAPSRVPVGSEAMLAAELTREVGKDAIESELAAVFGY